MHVGQFNGHEMTGSVVIAAAAAAASVSLHREEGVAAPLGFSARQTNSNLTTVKSANADIGKGWK